MLRFPPLSSRLKCSRISGDDLQNFQNIFDSFPIHSINLLIPSQWDLSSKGLMATASPVSSIGNLPIPDSNVFFKESYEDILFSDKNIYFMVKNMTVKSLIQDVFLERFVRTGLLLGVTQHARIGVENFISIIPPGKLVLSLEKDVAQCLALRKEHPPKNQKRKRLFQTIIINLTSTELMPGKKYYELISSELSKIDDMKFDMLLKWIPNENICPQSMKSYFISQGLECFACKPRYEYFDRCSVPVPKVAFHESDSHVLENFLEWIGMRICGIEYSVDEDDYASKLTIPEFSETLKKLHMCSFEGFYSKVDVLSTIEVMSKMFERDSSLPFIVICLTGYQDSYVVANGFQHFSSEDKQILLVIFPSSKYWVITLNAR